MKIILTFLVTKRTFLWQIKDIISNKNKNRVKIKQIKKKTKHKLKSIILKKHHMERNTGTCKELNFNFPTF